MINNTAFLIPYLALASHVLFVVLLFFLFLRNSKNSWGRSVTGWFGRHALILAFMVALAAVLGSLFYSEIIGFEPCVLCWWQRVFLYPSAVILGIALLKKDGSAFGYVVPLVIFSALVAAYQYYATSLGGASLSACTDSEGACSRIYVKEFGYITIELMSLTASLFILLFAWADKIYKNENRNA